jgi:hypothetical protein
VNLGHVAEIGAGDRHSSEALPLAGQATRVTLFEPNTLLAGDLLAAVHQSALSNVSVSPMAVGPQSGLDLLVHLGYASYLLCSPSFFRLGIEENGQAALDPEQWVCPLARSVVMAAIHEVDDGSWDTLYLTCNGSETGVLSGLVSRPNRIYTKHFMHNGEQTAEAQRVWTTLGEMGYRGVVLERNEHGTFCRVGWGRLA